MNKNLLVLVCMLVAQFVLGQNGITGIVNDGDANDVLPFANIQLKNTSKGATTDFEGKYTLETDPGTYDVIFSFVGYETKEITGVEVKNNEYFTLNVTLNLLTNNLDEVVVTTSVRRNTESSVLQLQKASVKLLDGISIQSIKKTGASDIAAAVKTVPGVSVVGGKYVYVRGLGDRYTKTILNGMDIPGLDPDRNTLQLDLFPTSILDNIQVVKSFTAESPADFTGGFVDVITKDIPTRGEYSITIGGGYNSSMHFNDDYLTSGTSNTDLLGFDDGKRNLRISRLQNIPSPADNSPVLNLITRHLDPEMAVKNDQSKMNFNFGISTGNQFDLGEETKLGYQAALTYRNTTDFYENAENNFWYKARADNSNYEMEPDRLQSGNIGKNNVLISGLAGLALKTRQSKYRLNVLHIQNGESTNAFFNVSSLLFDAVNGLRDNIEYTQRSITNAQLSGKHTNEDASWMYEWNLSPTLSLIDDKDVRFTSFEILDNGNLVIRPSSFGPPTRIWRGLEEINLTGKADVTRKHILFDKDAKLLFGGGYTHKQREFTIDQYFLSVRGTPATPINGNPDNLLLPENIWTPQTDDGTYLSGNYEPANSFESYSTLAAGYVSEEFNITQRLKSILGVRFEKFDLVYTGQNNQGTIVLEEEKVIDEADFFPSANLIYDLKEDGDMKLRGSYSRTTARPSFKEASIAQIFDPLTGRTFNGNIDIEPTYINNFDLRLEKYGENGQFFAVSAFYKSFTNPIELVTFETAPSNFEPRNVESANVIGAELEARQGLGFIDMALNDFAFNANISVINSKVDMSEREYQSRLTNAREGESIEDTRKLQGQSPYLVNVGFTYTGEDNGWQAGMFYNVQGKTLEVVGIAAIPDVYTLPFHNLNMNFSKEFGEERNSKITLKFSNILNDDNESVYQSFRATDQIYSFRRPGQEISLSYTYNF